MALEWIAVQGMSVVVDQLTVTPPAGAVLATIVVAPPTGTKNLSDSKLDHRHGDLITVTAITVPTAGATIPDPGPYVVPMLATATKARAEGVFVLREGDHSAVINAIPQIPATPDPIDLPIAFQCVVQSAGQLKARAQ